MKIALVTDTYYPSVNGVVTSTATFAEEMRQAGHEVYIIAPDFPNKPENEDNHIIRIPSLNLPFKTKDRVALPWFPFLTAKTEKKILTNGFDIIHTQTPFSLGIRALRWAKILQCPIIHTYHTLFEAYIHYLKILPAPLARKWNNDMSRWYCNKCHEIISPSTHIRDVLLGYGVKTEITILPTGIKLNRLKQGNGSDFRKQHAIPDNTPLLLYMGRIAKEKNIPFLFSVLRRVLSKKPEVKMVVAGIGPEKEMLTKMAESMNLSNHIIFCGHFKPQEWANCYTAADIFTFSSVTETQGLVVTEAMAAGTPVVAVGEMGVEEVMRGDKGGFLTPVDINKFAEKVLLLLENKELYTKKQDEAKRYAQEWSAEIMSQRMLALYQKVIRRTG